MSGAVGNAAEDGQVNLPVGVSVAIGEIAIMVAVSVLVKLVSADIDTVTVLLFRYVLCLPLLVATAIWQRGGEALSVTAPKTLAIRIVTGLISLACFYAALDLMALSLVTVLFQTLTLFVTFLAPLLVLLGPSDTLSDFERAVERTIARWCGSWWRKHRAKRPAGSPPKPMVELHAHSISN